MKKRKNIDLTETLLKKLTKEEVRAFCIAWANGSLDRSIIIALMSQDERNYPKDYGDNVAIVGGK